MNEHITEYLEYYIELKHPQYAILLKGKWGCGKTYYIKNLQEIWSKKNSTDDSIQIQPIYVSLNGVVNTKVINEKIRAEISPFLYSKGIQVAKKVLQGILKTTTKIDLNFDSDDKSDTSISFNIDSLGILSSENKEITGRRILIFDDIERCKIPTDEIFGYLNNFVEHTECKVILVSDEEKIKAKSDSPNSEIGLSYKDFKEKLIGQTFEIESNITDAISHFLKEIQELQKDKDFYLPVELIKSVFIASEQNNLRVLKQSLFDFIRLTTFFDDKFVKDQKYQEFLKNVLTYFLIVYIELKTGNDKIIEFQRVHLIEEKKDVISINLTEKYSTIVRENRLYHAAQVLPIPNIIKYIENGFIDKDELTQILQANDFFRPDERQEWERLWGWELLDEKEFKTLRKNVWSQFYFGNIFDPRILLHVAGIFITLKNNGLLDKRMELIIKIAKQNFNRIFSSLKTPINYFDSGFWDISFGKQYCAIGTNEFKELLKYQADKIDDHRSKSSLSYLKEIFDDIDENKIFEIYTLLNEVLPDRSTTYENTSIFKNIDGKKLGKRLMKLNLRAIYGFKSFIHSRYHPELRYSNGIIEKYHKDDLKCLKSMQNEINKNLNGKQTVRNQGISTLKNELANIIEIIERL